MRTLFLLFLLIVSSWSMEPQQQTLVGSPSGFQSEDRSGLMRYLIYSEDTGKDLYLSSIPLNTSNVNQGESGEQDLESIPENLSGQSSPQSSAKSSLALHKVLNPSESGSFYLLTGFQSKEYATPKLVSLKPEPSLWQKVGKGAFSVLLGAGVANGMIPVYLQLLELNGLNVESWLTGAMVTVGITYGLETAAKTYTRPLSWPMATKARMLWQIPTILVPPALLTMVEVSHRVCFDTTGYDQYMIYLTAIAPFLVMSSVLDALDRCDMVYRTKAMKRVESSIDQLTTDEIRRIRDELPNGEARIPWRKKPTWLGTCEAPVRYTVPVLALMGAWGAYSQILTDCSVPFPGAATLAIFPVLWSAFQWAQTVDTYHARWSYAVSMPWAAFKVLPYALLAINGLKAVKDDPGFVGLFLTFYGLQEGLNLQYEFDRWLNRAIFKMPALIKTPSGFKEFLKSRVNYDNDVS